MYFMFWLILIISAANAEILNRLANLACRRTTQNGYYGECIPRGCCRSTTSYRNLCLTAADYVCCYGENECELERNRRIQMAGSAIIPNHHLPTVPLRGTSEYCDRYLIRREEWGALPPTKRPFQMPPRVDYVVVHHSGDYADQCWSLDQCRQRLRQMQVYYQREKNFPDIPWNFLISNNGDVFEGVGWDTQGYHTESWNDRSIGISFIGDYDRDTPSPRALRAFIHLLECGVEQRVLDSYYRVQAHRDMKPTSCPGDHLYAALRRLKRTRLGNDISNTIDDDEFDFIDDFQQRSINNTNTLMK